MAICVTLVMVCTCGLWVGGLESAGVGLALLQKDSRKMT